MTDQRSDLGATYRVQRVTRPGNPSVLSEYLRVDPFGTFCWTDRQEHASCFTRYEAAIYVYVLTGRPDVEGAEYYPVAPR